MHDGKQLLRVDGDVGLIHPRPSVHSVAMPPGDARMAFLERLDDAARNLLLSVARPVSFARGARLLRAGDTSGGAYILRDGQADVIVALPGGERLTVATLGAGSLFGEQALFERGTATATVMASSRIEGWFVDREDFRALEAQRTPEAQRLRHALILVLAERLRAMNAQVMDVAAPEDRPVARRQAADQLAGVRRAGRPSFDTRPFLALLPAFEGFDEREIAEVLNASRTLELPRGHGVFQADQPADAAFIVLRGAVEIVASREGRERRMAVLGPGQIFGYMSLLAGGAHGAAARVRETAILLEMPRARFEALYGGAHSVSSALHYAIQRSLLASLAQTNRHRSRLISLARLRGAHREGDKLQTELGGQIVAAPD
jgi:CRP-like cAMP-binding protein